MGGAQWLLLCQVEAYDVPRLLTMLSAVECGAERLGQGGWPTMGRVGVLVVASSGEIPLVLAMVRGTCARHVAAGGAQAALAVMANPLAEEIGGATVLAMPIRNSARWTLGDLPRAHNANRRWEMLDAAILEAEAFSLSTSQPTKLLVAIVPDRSTDRILAAPAKHQVRAMVVGSTGGFFRRQYHDRRRCPC
jgi:uncharacterized protein YaaQ